MKRLFKRLFKKLRKMHYMHYISIGITLGFLALAVFVFSKGIIRVFESAKDLFWSFCYYFDELLFLPFEPQITVNEYSSVGFAPAWFVPESWEGFKVSWVQYWKVWASMDNLFAYLNFILNGSKLWIQIFLLLGAPLILLGYVLLQRYMNTHNNDYNKDSLPLRGFKWLVKYTYVPVRDWIKSFIAFVLSHKAYCIIWLCIWCYNFNVFVILIEALAYYMYFVISFDFLSLYKQIFKLLCDLSVPVAFLPVWVWIIVGIVVFLCFRRKIAYSILYHHEACNCGFINERPIVSMTCGTMGKKKTTMITDMMLLQEKMFRDKALELLLENDLKFPNFPWCNLENALRYAISEHIVFSLATARKFIKHLRYCFEAAYTSETDIRSCVRRHFKKRFKLPYKNLMFDYDFEKYGLYYDDKLKPVYVWDVIETYSQLYFVYVIKSSLIVSNFSVRTDGLLHDLGNLPMRDGDFYRRNSKFIYELSRYAHIIDFNAMRLGKKLGEDDPKKDSFEFGVVGKTEIGKERKNNLQLQDLKKKEDEANQKNDGYNDWMKMIRHSATIDYFPFVKVFTDEQRPESWGADARDLLEIIHIKDGGKTKLALPFFFIEELLYDLIYGKFISMYKQYRFMRSDNTLLIYLFKKLAASFNTYYKRTYNMFGYSKMTLQVESGTQDGELATKAYYLDNKRIYSDRFSTDCFSDFFTAKSLRSTVGLDDLEEYGTSKATFNELKMQNSYFIADLMNKQEKF